ncbi:MAG TPA: 2-dehydropantoate 2-reductase [Gemmatimonadaceae bacterium]|nr:2-dehydropantoate 2-reductase [Gemmatimonadaceae bacterium]
MRIAIIGAGGVGGYYGAKLTEAGHDVTLLARGAHLDAIRKNGMVIKDHDKTFSVPVKATDRPQDLRGAEWAMLAVKSYSVAELADVLVMLARNGTAIVPALNGVTAAEHLETLGVPRDQILGGTTIMNAHKIAPGVIERLSNRERFAVGELDGSISARAESIAEAMRSAGDEAVATREIVLELWMKFNMLCACAAACGMARSELGPIRDTELGRLLIDRAVREIAAVARAMRVPIPSTQEEDALARIAALPATLKPSFVLDVERGGPTELDVLSGAVSRFGRQTGVPTPVHDTATAVLAPYSRVQTR